MVEVQREKVPTLKYVVSNEEERNRNNFTFSSFILVSSNDVGAVLTPAAVSWSKMKEQHLLQIISPS